VSSTRLAIGGATVAHVEYGPGAIPVARVQPRPLLRAMPAINLSDDELAALLAAACGTQEDPATAGAVADRAREARPGAQATGRACRCTRRLRVTEAGGGGGGDFQPKSGLCPRDLGPMKCP
jgi:hypothetical protein